MEKETKSLKREISDEWPDSFDYAMADRVLDAVEEAIMPLIEYAVKNIQLADKTPKYEYSQDDRDRNNAGELPSPGSRWGMPREIAESLEWNVRDTLRRLRDEEQPRAPKEKETPPSEEQS